MGKDKAFDYKRQKQLVSPPDTRYYFTSRPTLFRNKDTL